MRSIIISSVKIVENFYNNGIHLLVALRVSKTSTYMNDRYPLVMKCRFLDFDSRLHELG